MLPPKTLSAARREWISRQFVGKLVFLLHVGVSAAVLRRSAIVFADGSAIVVDRIRRCVPARFDDGRTVDHKYEMPTLRTSALSNPGPFLGRNGFQVASVHSIAKRSPIVCSLPIEVDSRSRATAIVRQVPPKSTVSLPCDSAESSHPFTRADLADLGAI